MDSLELTFHLLDRCSPTLEVMDHHLAQTKRSIDSVDKALRDLDRAQKQAHFNTERDPMKRYRLGLELMREELAGAKSGASDAGGSLAMFGGAAGAAAAAAQIAAGAFTAMARAVADGAIAITRFAIESASFKRDTVMAFELIEGSAKGAGDTFERLSSLADKTPFKTSDVLTFGKVLRSTGFTIRQTEDLLAGMFDVGAVQGKEGPEKVRSLLEGITKIKGRDALNLETLEQVITSGAAAGLNMQSITAAIARNRKVTIAQAAALIHAGQVKGNEGINAILDAIQTATDQGGPLGKATMEFGQKSLSGQLSTFSSRLESIFYSVDIQPLIDILKTVNELLDKDSPTGKRIREFATETLGGMFKTAARWLTPENIEIALNKVVNGAEAVRAAIALAGDAVEGFAEGFSEGFTAIPDKIDPVTEALNGFNNVLGGEDKKRDWKEFGRSIGLLVDLMVSLGKAILWVDSHLAAFKELAAVALPTQLVMSVRIASLVSSIAGNRDGVREPTEFHREVGRSAADGVALGIADRSASVRAAASGLASDVLDTTSRTLEINSPSRAMRRLGLETGEGFELGVRDSEAERAVTALVASPHESAENFASSRTRGAISITLGDVHVYGADAGTAQAAGREVRRSIRAELLALLEEMESAA